MVFLPSFFLTPRWIQTFFFYIKTIQGLGIQSMYVACMMPEFNIQNHDRKEQGKGKEERGREERRDHLALYHSLTAS
jgi:hypothetical protein